MARKVWVQVAPNNVRGQYYDEVVDETTGKIVPEHVRAETVNGEQVPVPVQMTDTVALRQAMNERVPGTSVPARLVECSREDVDAHLRRHGLLTPPTAALEVSEIPADDAGTTTRPGRKA